MPREPRLIADRLVARLRGIERTRRRVETLLESNQVSVRDLETIYAGLFTNAVTSMEAFLEDLFVGLACNGLHSRRAHPRTVFRQGAVATEFILNGRDYVEWLPYHRTKERAEVFFRKGRPFTELPGHLEDHLKKASIIRNALVHSSQWASDQFEKNVIGTTALPPKERRPVGFLRSVFRIGPTQHRFQVYLTAFADVARFLSQKA